MFNPDSGIPCQFQTCVTKSASILPSIPVDIYDGEKICTKEQDLPLRQAFAFHDGTKFGNGIDFVEGKRRCRSFARAGDNVLHCGWLLDALKVFVAEDLYGTDPVA
jgi:hypothetical protein